MSTQWEIKGPSFGGCNCDWNCPCQYNLKPTHGHCQGIDGMLIEEGHYDGTPLDGLLYVGLYKWPGPIEDGNGRFQAIIDERANEAQRHALTQISYGRVTEEVITYFDIFASLMSEQIDPLFLPIEFECDMEKRTGRVGVKGIVACTGEPIIDPHSGGEHRVRLVMPNGFEFQEAEIGSATTKATGEVALDFSGAYGQWAIYHFNQDGIVRS